VSTSHHQNVGNFENVARSKCLGTAIANQSYVEMCLDETHSEVRLAKSLSDTFQIQNGLKQGDNLSPLFFNFALEYTIGKDCN
jgi:hypothetical protein